MHQDSKTRFLLASLFACWFGRFNRLLTRFYQLGQRRIETQVFCILTGKPPFRFRQFRFMPNLPMRALDNLKWRMVALVGDLVPTALNNPKTYRYRPKGRAR